MNSKQIGIGIVILVVVILFITLIPGGKTGNTDGTPPQDVEGFVPQEIIALHTFEDGLHTLSGEIDLPTPCHTLTHDALVAESFPEQVTINFETEIDEGVVCAQVITPTQFEVTFEASEEASIRTRFNDTNVPLTLVSPDEAEIEE